MKVFFAAAAPFELAQRWTDSLWNGKTERIARMRRESDKALALTAHRLLCYAIRTEHGIEPLPQDFALEPKGKPYLKAAPDIHFSISHSGTMAMCALHDQPVGADIEKVRAVARGVPERIMSAAEHELYMRSSDKKALFFQIWTLKEAYIKYCGEGLGLAMNSFTVCPSGRGLTDTGCEFWMTQHIPGYQAAVCAKSGASPDIVMVDTQQLSSH